MKRTLVLLYGVVAYLLFLGTFLYAIGFVTGIGVPKDIDDGAPVPLLEALLVNLSIMALFALQHTVMARPWFKRRWTRLIPEAAERSTFVVATVLVFALLFTQWRPLTDPVWQVGSPLWANVITGVSLFGFGVVVLATFQIGHFELFGLRQTVAWFFGKQIPPALVKTPFLYAMVRHPIMLGFVIAFWATPHMTVGHLLFAGVVTSYVLIGVQIEERDLVRAHGADYLAYRERVPMLLPSVFGKKQPDRKLAAQQR